MAVFALAEVAALDAPAEAVAVLLETVGLRTLAPFLLPARPRTQFLVEGGHLGFVEFVVGAVVALAL